ncbi:MULTISPECIES: ferritin-like domain-containing protein [Kordiimonas]|jgi:DNA-binding ferritin-like protein|uniref:ferritin-like domain-containing protein n=1 Tax=Kordiimonas TaxID=288021 RepID=UPI00257C18C1|nr:ferritin-like domain-containing protein [Kordiimonas sp. UBA4487]
MSEEPGEMQTFDTVAVNLHEQLKQHQDMLEAEGMVVELGALVYWTDRVARGQLSARDALDKHGLGDLLALKRRIAATCVELENATQYQESEDVLLIKKQQEYSKAYEDLSVAIDCYLKAAYSMKPEQRLKDFKQVSDLAAESSLTSKASNNKGRKAVLVEPLAGLLVTIYSLYVKSLYYRWNSGKKSAAHAHEMLDHHCTAISQIGDELAKRISALGHSTPGQLRAYAAFAAERDDLGQPGTPVECINALIVANQVCMSEARRVFDVARAVRDETTVELVNPIFTFHNRAIQELKAVRSATEGSGGTS